MNVVFVQGINTAYRDTYDAVEGLLEPIHVRFFYTTREEPLPKALERLVCLLKSADAILAHSLGAVYLRLACELWRPRVPIVLTNAVVNPRAQLGLFARSPVALLKAARDALAGARSLLQSLGIPGLSPRALYVPTCIFLAEPLTYLEERLWPTWREWLGGNLFGINLEQVLDVLLRVDALAEDGALWRGHDVRLILGTDDDTTPLGRVLEVEAPSRILSLQCRHEPFNDSRGVQQAWVEAVSSCLT